MNERSQMAEPDVPSVFAQFSIAATSPDYPDGDPRWREQASVLYRELRQWVDGVAFRHDAIPGTKGSVETVVISLSSAGAAAAMVQIMKLWLDNRRTSRAIEVDGNINGKPIRMRIRSARSDQASFQAFVTELGKAAGQVLADPSAPEVETEDSR
jgi:hypothetical protein